MFDLICQWLYFHKLVGMISGHNDASYAMGNESSLPSSQGTCWLLLSTLDRGGDCDCLLDSDFAFVASHTFLTSVCGHVTLRPQC